MLEDPLLLRSTSRGATSRDAPIARLVAALADGRSESVLESLSRAVMFEQGFPKPELQVRLVDSDGEFGRGDFGWPGLIGGDQSSWF